MILQLGKAMDTRITKLLEGSTPAINTFDLVDNLKLGIVIPKLQRTYVWREKQWMELWHDVLACYDEIFVDKNEDAQHFMGVLTLGKEKDKYCLLLDGQQRLTTVLVLIDCLQGLSKVPANDRLSNPLDSPWVSWGNGEIEAEKNYKEIYDYFLRTFIFERNTRLGNTQDFYAHLLEVLLYRFFWIEIKTDDNPNTIFEGINATGKQIEYSDFVLNFILELSTNKSTNNVAGASSEDIKKSWNNILQSIYLGKTIPEEAEDISDEEQQNKPLKFKKFMNAMHSLTIENAEAVSEDMNSFAETFLRLHNSYEKEEWSKDELNAEYIINSIIEWGNIYAYAINPSNICKDLVLKILGKADDTDIVFEREMYLLSTMISSKQLPMMMRVLYAFKENKLSGECVNNLFGAVNRILLYPEIFSARNDSRERASLKNLSIIDYILNAALLETKQKSLSIAQIIYLVTGSELYEEMRSFDAYADVVNYQYNSRFSKAILVIEHDYNQNSSEAIYEIERRNILKNNSNRPYFEVEHLVAQNIECAGGFLSYGFTTETIGTVNNLILLEGGLNASAGNKTPQEKIDIWKTSSLHDFYRISLPADNNIFSSQKNRIEALTKVFKAYMNLPFVMPATNDSEKQAMMPLTYDISYPLFFMVIRKSGSYTHWIKSSTSFFEYLRGLKNQNVSDLAKWLDEQNIYSRYLLQDMKISDTMPNIEDTKNHLCGCIWGNELSDLVEEKEGDEDNFALSKCISLFLECWKKEKGVQGILAFLKEKENEDGDFTRFKDGREFCPYDPRLIHTKAFREQNELNSKGKKTTAAWTDTEHAKRSSLFEDVIEFNYAYNAEEVAKKLKQIYIAANLSFAFICRMTQAQQAFVLDDKKGTLITPYICVGNETVFRKWISKCFIESEKDNDIDGAKDSDTDWSRDCETNNAIDKTEAKGLEYISTFFKTKAIVLKDIVTECEAGSDPLLFTIPEYQRAYVWDEKNWNALLDSIEEGMHANSDIALGTIIVYTKYKNEGDKQIFDGEAESLSDEISLKIVDGQQRMTTLGMFLQILSGDTKRILRTPLIDEKIHKRIEKWMVSKAFSEIEKQKLIDYLLNNIRLTLMIIDDAPSLYQYEIFTSVNGKGKKLTLEEKTKNYIYKCIGGATTKAVEEAIHKISTTEGFLKAYVELNKKEIVSEIDQYNEIKILIDSLWAKSGSDEAAVLAIYEYLIAFDILSLTADPKNMKKYNDKKWFFLHLYQELRNVHTADALLTDVIYRVNNQTLSESEANLIIKNVVMYYFFLYVMDKSGNDKKSINAKLPKLVGAMPDAMKICKDKTKNAVASSILTDSERGILFNGQNKINETIWHNYVMTVDLIDTSKEISRFILYLVEYWLGMDIAVLDRIVLDDVIDGKKTPDIEHIHPASKDKKDDASGLNINWLENICLLESDINRSVGDKSLYNVKDRVGKLIKKEGQTRTHTYKESRFIMPNRFYHNGQVKEAFYEVIDGEWVYTKKCADERSKDLWNEISSKCLFENDVDGMFLM